MSSPNSVGIDPARASGSSFEQVVGSCTKQAKMSKRGRTGQFVHTEKKFLHVDELAELRGD
jgi:hypothetical protein